MEKSTWTPMLTMGDYILWKRLDPISQDLTIYRCCHKTAPPEDRDDGGYILASAALKQKGL